MNEKIVLNTEIEWPYNLLFTIYFINYNPKHKLISYYHKDIVDYFLKESLCTRDYEIIKSRYEDCKSISELSTIFNLSKPVLYDKIKGIIRYLRNKFFYEEIELIPIGKRYLVYTTYTNSDNIIFTKSIENYLHDYLDPKILAAFRRANIYNIGQLYIFDKQSMLSSKGFSPNIIKSINKVCKQIGGWELLDSPVCEKTKTFSVHMNDEFLGRVDELCNLGYTVSYDVQWGVKKTWITRGIRVYLIK